MIYYLASDDMLSILLEGATETCCRKAAVVFELKNGFLASSVELLLTVILSTVQKRAKQQRSCHYSLQKANSSNPTNLASCQCHGSVTFLIWTKSYNNLLLNSMGWAIWGNIQLSGFVMFLAMLGPILSPSS